MFYYIVLLLSICSPLVPLCTGWRERSVIWLYALVCLTFDVNGFILKTLGIERLWASNLFFLLEFLLLSAYFNRNVFREDLKNISPYLTLTIALFFIIYTLNGSILTPNYVGAAILYMLYILFALAGLYKVIREAGSVPVWRSSLFIICVALLLYTSGSFIILLLENHLLSTHKDFIIALWKFVRNPANIFKNLLLGYALWLERKNYIAPELPGQVA